MVEPLPLVPATWMTGGSLRSGWPSAASSRSHAIERQVDQLGMQREQRASTVSSRVGLERRLSYPFVPAKRGSRATAENWIPATRDDGSALGAARHRGASRARRPVRAARAALRRRLGQQPAQIGQRGAQLVAVHDHVDHAVLLADIRRAGSRPAASRGWSARSRAGRRSRSARRARRYARRPAWRRRR